MIKHSKRLLFFNIFKIFCEKSENLFIDEIVNHFLFFFRSLLSRNKAFNYGEDDNEIIIYNFLLRGRKLLKFSKKKQQHRTM